MNLLDYLCTPELLIHIANIFLLVSFSAKSMLVLRALNIIAGGFFVAYFFLLPQPLWASIAWNVLFGVVNVWRIWLAILERRPPHLSAEEQALYHRAFANLSPREYRKLLDCGQWENGLPPVMLSARGETPKRLWMVAEGLIEVRCINGNTRPIKPGDFVGETSFLSNNPMAADITIAEPVRFISWATRDLEDFMDSNPQIGAILQRLLGQCLVRKLNAVS